MKRIKNRRRRKGTLIGRTGELTHGSSKKFTLRCAGRTIEALLVNYEGNFFAYVNRCRHIPISMDWVDNRFFTEDGRYIICANHGATYEPRTGECVWGPCFGAFLRGVPLKIDDEKVFAFCPEADERDE